MNVLYCVLCVRVLSKSSSEVWMWCMFNLQPDLEGTQIQMWKKKVDFSVCTCINISDQIRFVCQCKCRLLYSLLSSESHTVRPEGGAYSTILLKSPSVTERIIMSVSVYYSSSSKLHPTTDTTTITLTQRIILTHCTSSSRQIETLWTVRMLILSKYILQCSHSEWASYCVSVPNTLQKWWRGESRSLIVL